MGAYSLVFLENIDKIPLERHNSKSNASRVILLDSITVTVHSVAGAARSHPLRHPPGHVKHRGDGRQPWERLP
jgi:hypothetical protein